MAEKAFAIGEALAAGWRHFAERPLFWIGLTAFYSAVQVALNVVDDAVEQALSGNLVALPIAGVVFFIVQVYILARLTIGLFSIYLATEDGGRPAFGAVISNGHLIWRYIGASVIFYMMTFVGFLLLIVPGIYLVSRFGFYGFALIDNDAGVFDSLRISSRITEEHRWPLVLLVLVLFLILLLGFVALFIGLLVAVPVVTLSLAFVYRRLAVTAGLHAMRPAPENTLSAVTG